MSSTEFTAGLPQNKHSNVKVLKPPGGGSSDIFGGDNQQTPRSIKNHMKSNIFAAPEPVNKNGDKSRRVNTMDSHNRLFGDVNRPGTPAKNHMKSSIPFGGIDAVDTNGHGKTNGSTNGSMNGHSETNCKPIVNGNGVAHTNGHTIHETGISKTNGGNPVTGEGYIKPATAEINMQVPALNGSALNGSRDHVINKNRVPPGGYSSGLW